MLVFLKARHGAMLSPPSKKNLAQVETRGRVSIGVLLVFRYGNGSLQHLLLAEVGASLCGGNVASILIQFGSKHKVLHHDGAKLAELMARNWGTKSIVAGYCEFLNFSVDLRV